MRDERVPTSSHKSATTKASADVLDFDIALTRRSQVCFEGAVEELEQHLETDAGNRWVVSAFAKLITDEGIWSSISPCYSTRDVAETYAAPKPLRRS